MPLIQKLSQTEAEATQITFVEDQVNSFTELIDRQITTLETLLTDWKVLNNNMIQIQKNVDEGTYTDSSLLQKHFNQIKKVSDEMNKQTNQFEDYVTNVEVH